MTFGTRTLGALIAVIALSTALAPTATAQPSQANGPAVYPRPQSTTSRPETVRIPATVNLVVADGADWAAVGVVRDVLVAAGVRKVDDRGSALSVYVGRHPDALQALGVKGTEGMGAEGYVVAVGTGRDRLSRMVVDGVDDAGTFYAAQTLRQLVQGSAVRGVEVRDWPSLRWRGVVEGFYGPPWSHEARLDSFDYFGRHKMNLYFYTPKDDPYLRAEWRLPYPADQLARLDELVKRAKANHVEFGYVLSPGLSICYSRESETDTLIAKFTSLYRLGVRMFVVALDDIDYQRWNCDEDRAAFGTGPAAAASAQAHVINRVQREFVAANPGTLPVQTVPTEYWGLNKSAYTNKLASTLDPNVIVQWTGVDVVSRKITKAEVATAHDNFQHPLLLWDNYPVNDYVPGRLLLGPLTAREPGLGASTTGLAANPMPQAHASRPALFTVADYTWNDTAYDPARSWAAGLAELAGGNKRTLAALTAFADVNFSSRLDERQAPRLTGDIDRFWKAWSAGNPAAAFRLYNALRQVHDAPGVLRETLRDPAFLADTKPWLDATGAWGQAALTALDMLAAQRAGNGELAWARRQALPALVAKARSFVWVGLDPNRTVRVDVDPVVDRFVKDAVADNDRWLGLRASTVTPSSSLPLYDSQFPVDNMVDGDPDTYFWGGAAAQPGTVVGVDLGTVRPVTGVDVLMAKDDRPSDYIQHGVVEYSTDGTTWTTGPVFHTTTEVRVDLGRVSARFVRLKATRAQPNWVVVREFEVRLGDNPVVSGAPEGDFPRAADGKPGTAYRATRPPTAGEALTVVLPEARRLDKVVILADARAEVQVRTGDRWATIGRLTSSYTALAVHGTTDAIRLEWKTGSPPPVVYEIVGHG
ncbi:beta-N-acetylglucosaminidase domain-containing protein [Kibdelosporangium phytohabitans]|uniref:Uncharacterized protein n=1 Tax=Kibdelosporangium phytohabitans TaxID=860235 RepID=A0A0N9I4U4_9PSEU|nr:beta-N-acetylglucosaminidase domain-containing protein [Kibdelosporangium phytohabitans]ALG10651.1 hypothetical protein AOZ06_30485 [Kibdelosporangium phytohabitans]MBE1461771.1 hyaluronoglucosaminidase [Kibdelosporangium phytohabitans]